MKKAPKAKPVKATKLKVSKTKPADPIKSAQAIIDQDRANRIKRFEAGMVKLIAETNCELVILPDIKINGISPQFGIRPK